MIKSRNLTHFRYIVPLVLLGMVLMRLVWLQIRVYSTEANLSALSALHILEFSGKGCHLVDSQKVSEAANSLFTGAARSEDRLVAIQWFSSKGYETLVSLGCESGAVAISKIIDSNMAFLFLVVLLCVLTSRFLARSWIVGLLVCVTLLSRGQLTEKIGAVSTVLPLTFFVTFWATSLSHFVRSGSLYVMAISMAGFIAAVFYEYAIIGLGLGIPIAFFVGYSFRRAIAFPILENLRIQKKMRKAYERENLVINKIRPNKVWPGLLNYFFEIKPDSDYIEGKKTQDIYIFSGLFRTLDNPFAIWIYRSNRWLKLGMIWLVLTLLAGTFYFGILYYDLEKYVAISKIVRAISIGNLLSISSDFYINWFKAYIAPIDFHYIISFCVLFTNIVMFNSIRYRGFYECCWIVLIGLLSVTISGLTADIADWLFLKNFLGLEQVSQLQGFKVGVAHDILIMFEPIILTFGIIGCFNLMNIGDRTVSRRKAK